MSLQKLHSFFASPPTSFAQLSALTAEVAKDRRMIGKDVICKFINVISHTFDNINKAEILDRDWQIFDRSFSALVKGLGNEEELLEKIFKIETLAKRRFMGIDDSLVPIVLKGAESKNSLVSKARLDSVFFQKMFSAHFNESQSREISFECLSAGAFECLVDFFTCKIEAIPVEHQREILAFSHAYAMPDLFVDSFDAVLDFLQYEPRKKRKGVLTGLKDACQFLCSVLGVDRKVVESRFLASASIPPEEHLRRLHLEGPQGQQQVFSMAFPQSTLEEFYTYLMPKDALIHARLLDLLVLFGKCIEEGMGVVKDVNEALKLYRFAADRGCANGQYNLAVCYEKGIGVQQNFFEAVKWYKPAAAQGIAQAQNMLGMCYENGTGCAKNLEGAVTWFRRAAEQGYVPAQNNLGFCYQKGIGVQQNLIEAVRLYKLAADSGFAPAQCNLGLCYLEGIGVQQDFTKSLQYFQLAANQENADGHFWLGFCYYYGAGVHQDINKALRLYRLASDSGSALAQNMLGSCFQNGIEVEQNLIEAVRLFRLASDSGLPMGQYNLGICYGFGIGIQRDLNEALRLYRLASDSEYAPAQNNLAVFFRDDTVVQQNFIEAVRLFRLAADSGYALAQYNLGDCYELGLGVQPNLIEAVRLYRLSAEQGYSEAQLKLANCYEFGIGVQRDYFQAMRWAFRSLHGRLVEPTHRFISSHFTSLLRFFRTPFHRS